MQSFYRVLFTIYSERNVSFINFIKLIKLYKLALIQVGAISKLYIL